MPNVTISSEALQSIQTTSDLHRVIADLEVLLRSGNSIWKPESSVQTLKSATAQLLSVLVSEGGPAVDIAELMKTLQTLPVVKLTVAFAPGPSVLAPIVSWLRTQVDANCLIEIVVDPSVLAGAMIVYKGKYADYSLAKRWSSMETQVSEIIQTALKQTDL